MPSKTRSRKERRLRGNHWHLEKEKHPHNRMLLHIALKDNNLYTQTEVKKLLADCKIKTGLFIRR